MHNVTLWYINKDLHLKDKHFNGLDEEPDNTWILLRTLNYLTNQWSEVKYFNTKQINKYETVSLQDLQDIFFFANKFLFMSLYCDDSFAHLPHFCRPNGRTWPGHMWTGWHSQKPLNDLKVCYLFVMSVFTLYIVQSAMKWI